VPLWSAAAPAQSWVEASPATFQLGLGGPAHERIIVRQAPHGWKVYRVTQSLRVDGTHFVYVQRHEASGGDDDFASVVQRDYSSSEEAHAVVSAALTEREERRRRLADLRPLDDMCKEVPYMSDLMKKQDMYRSWLHQADEGDVSRGKEHLRLGDTIELFTRARTTVSPSGQAAEGHGGRSRVARSSAGDRRRSRLLRLTPQADRAARRAATSVHRLPSPR
jgi:hypothetical protein